MISFSRWNTKSAKCESTLALAVSHYPLGGVWWSGGLWDLFWLESAAQYLLLTAAAAACPRYIWCVRVCVCVRLNIQLCCYLYAGTGCVRAGLNPCVHSMDPVALPSWLSVRVLAELIYQFSSSPFCSLPCVNPRSFPYTLSLSHCLTKRLFLTNQKGFLSFMHAYRLFSLPLLFFFSMTPSHTFLFSLKYSCVALHVNGLEPWYHSNIGALWLFQRERAMIYGWNI